MMFLASHGYRCIAHDRRGHGRLDQPWKGNDVDTYASPVAVFNGPIGKDKIDAKGCGVLELSKPIELEGLQAL